MINQVVAEVCGLDVATLTSTERGRLMKSVKEILEVGGTPTQVRSRAVEYRRRYTKATLTDRALAANWSSLGAGSSPPSPRLPQANRIGLSTALWAKSLEEARDFIGDRLSDSDEADTALAIVCERRPDLLPNPEATAQDTKIQFDRGTSPRESSVVDWPM